jgi:hypothetical protein
MAHNIALVVDRGECGDEEFIAYLGVQNRQVYTKKQGEVLRIERLPL